MSLWCQKQTTQRLQGELSVDGGSSPDIVSTPSGQIRNLLVEYVWYRVRIGTECPSWIWPEMIMRSLLSFVAPSAIAILSTALLCSLSGTAMSQTATGSAAPLPSVTVVAPKQVARPRQVARPPQRPAQAATVASRRTAPTAQTSSASPEAIIAGPDPTLGKLAKLEKASSSCNGGCETSFKSGNAPWVGCSEAAGLFHTFSATCRDTLTYKSYLECRETKIFLGLDRPKAWWLCSSLAAGGKFKVAELKRSRR